MTSRNMRESGTYTSWVATRTTANSLTLFTGFMTPARLQDLVYTPTNGLHSKPSKSRIQALEKYLDEGVNPMPAIVINLERVDSISVTPEVREMTYRLVFRPIPEGGRYGSIIDGAIRADLAQHSARAEQMLLPVTAIWNATTSMMFAQTLESQTKVDPRLVAQIKRRYQFERR